MKNITKKLNIFALASVLLTPAFAFADTSLWGTYDYDTDYGTYDYSSYGNYDYDTPSNYGTYDYSDYGTYDYGSNYGTYDYGSDYGTYDYNNSNYGTYDYSDYGTYDYGSNYGTYDYGSNYGTYDYSNYGTYDYSNPYWGTYDYTNTGTQNSSPAQSIYTAPTIYQSQMPQMAYYNEGGDYWQANNSYNGYDGYNYQNYYGGGCTYNCGTSGRDTVVIRDRIIRDDNNNNNDLEVICRVSDTYVDEGDRVTFTAEVDGGDSPYKYSWRGDISGSSRTKTYTFDDRGTYDVTIRVTDDDGNTATDECSVRVGDDGSYSNSYDDYSNGGYASVDSVFLNQVPYTGPADTMKGIGFIALVLAWSFAIAYAIRKKMNRSETVKKIEEFKNSNRQTQTIS